MSEYLNETWQITQAEFDKGMRTLFDSLEPPRLKVYSAKAKKKVIALMVIVRCFEKGRTYTEREVNDILAPVWADYATIRRALIDFGFMARSAGGAAYWVV